MHCLAVIRNWHTYERSFRNVELDKFARVSAMLQPGRVALGVSHMGKGPD